PVNAMPAIGTQPQEQPAYPAQVLLCRHCQLAQLGLVVDPEVLFPPTYPYTSGTTRILRDNFAELSREVQSLYPLGPDDLADVLELLDDDGIFITESHYLLALVQDLQYDTIYHEHLRYYSLTSLAHLLERHGLEVLHARRIPTHGGSIRVYAARRGKRPARD